MTEVSAHLLSDYDPLQWAPYDLPQAEKAQLLLARLNELTAWHTAGCPSFAALMAHWPFPQSADAYADLPFVMARLFKQSTWVSVPPESRFKTLTSSGTSGQVSTIILDRDTARLQGSVLIGLWQAFLGTQRLPMLIADSRNLIRDRRAYGVRGAAVLGMLPLGFDHTYALDENLQPDWEAIDGFVARHADQPAIIFGFTSVLWQGLMAPLMARGRQLPLQSRVVHGGGWKKLADQAIDNDQFAAACRQALGAQAVHNYYGMVEQTGSIFIQCEAGHLHAPVMADVLVRDPATLRELPHGDIGVLQVLSALPQSYPGYSILTEDLGRIISDGVCACGRHGRRFEVLGRIPKAELRGCSDVERGGRA